MPSSDTSFAFAAARRRSAIGGTSGRKVAGCFLTTSRTRSGSNFGKRTSRAPIDIANVRHRVRP